VLAPLAIGQITATRAFSRHHLSRFLGARQNGIGPVAVGQDRDLYLLEKIAIAFGNRGVSNLDNRVSPVAGRSRSGGRIEPSAVVRGPSVLESLLAQHGPEHESAIT
jgi:hypothetical protein